MEKLFLLFMFVLSLNICNNPKSEYYISYGKWKSSLYDGWFVFESIRKSTLSGLIWQLNGGPVGGWSGIMWQELFWPHDHLTVELGSIWRIGCWPEYVFNISFHILNPSCYSSTLRRSRGCGGDLKCLGLI